MTFKQLKDIVALKSGVVGNPLYPDVRLGLYVNLAQRWVQSQMIAVDRKRFERNILLSDLTGGTGKIIPITLSPLVNCYAMPTYLMEVSNSILSASITYKDSIDQDTFVTFIATEIEEAESFKELLLNSYTRPVIPAPIFYRGANEIYIAPNVGYYYLDGVKVIYNLYEGSSITYLKYLDELNSDSASCELPLDAQDQIINKAVEDILSDLGNVQESLARASNSRTDIASAMQSDVMLKPQSERLQ